MLALALLTSGTASLTTLNTADAAPPDGDPLMDQMEAELDRVWETLSQQPEPPYWVQLAWTDRTSFDVQASYGAAGPIGHSHRRTGDVDLRVGSPQLDNTHKIRDAGWFSDDPRPRLDLPLDDLHPRPAQMSLWRAVDDTYQSALRRLIKVRTNQAVKVAREDTSDDFSSAEPVVDIGPITPLTPDMQAWRDRVRAASAVLTEYPQVLDGNVSFTAQRDVSYLISSEGTRLRQQRDRLRVSVLATTIADDGMELQVYDYVDAASLDNLPDGPALTALARRAAQQVVDLRQAPLVEPWAGPAILRGRAAAVFFHEILGHRVEGHRQKDEDEGQTLTDMVGEPIFPDFISVHDDPTLRRWTPEPGHSIDLNGTYSYDDEGVPAQRVTVVDHGVLRHFLMSRSPIAGFPHSNGHGRRQIGSAPIPRQGNLIVSASEAVSYEALRDMLIDQIRSQHKEFGLIFDDISGGFTFTGRSTPNSYSVQPVTVWRVFPDGRPDQLVRGVDLIGTPLTTFSRILAASDHSQVFNGMCGAESGWVPVSAVAPDLLISEMEVQRREKENDRPPLLPPPISQGGG